MNEPTVEDDVPTEPEDEAQFLPRLAALLAETPPWS